MMGLNDVSDGAFYAEDVEYSKSFDTAEERTKANKKVAIERVKNYGIMGLGKHTIKKVLGTYNDGTFGWWNEGMDNGNPDYSPDESQGGDAALKAEIAKYQANGNHLLLYYNGKLIDRESRYYKSGMGAKVCRHDNTGSEILERYKDCPFDELLPLISQQKYNVAIKKMFLDAGLTRPVVVYNPTTSEQEIRPLNEVASSHLARRCFVGNLYKQVKDPNLVGALSGHKEGSRAFARYREIDEDMKRDLVSMLE